MLYHSRVVIDQLLCGHKEFSMNWRKNDPFKCVPTWLYRNSQFYFFEFIYLLTFLSLFRSFLAVLIVFALALVFALLSKTSFGRKLLLRVIFFFYITVQFYNTVLIN